ncbi:Endonuclease/exonuclease/phosphatase [Microdochium trichocladiopsis]|uniref:Endonuclease/exonuclease/phosphatase n=1 Tax=Microdochium trichocladiopsis TaxID=1682393 RepID=A0A9P8YFK8_9PEZI|nr:Endonuclease/exonuclease/phosphatase [Microdochium trichocladiopsis]KAH7040847.1 Endonuclease/exonuclease/phosphatase [Microdochium trichocladiopsis]
MTAAQYGRISPPPLKRRKRESPNRTTPSDSTNPSSTSILQKPNRGTGIRIVAWNINGIQPFVQGYLQKTLHSFFQSSITARSRKRQHSPGDSQIDGKFPGDPSKESRPSLRDALRRQHWPEVLLLQEIKIKPGDEKTMSAVRVAANDGSSLEGGPASMQKLPNHVSSGRPPLGTLLADGGPRYEVHFVLPSDPHNARGFGGKVYGVCAILRQDFMQDVVSCIREPPLDREGRVQIIETHALDVSVPTNIGSSSSSSEHKPSTVGKDDSRGPLKLAIINIYAVNGTFNPYHSTHTGAVIGTRHDRKLAMHTELLQEAHRLESRGFSVVIAGDLNIARERIDGYPNLRTSPHQHVLNRADFNQKFFASKVLPPDSSSVVAARYRMNELPGKKDGNLAEAQGFTADVKGLKAIDTFRYIHGNLRKYSWHSRTKEWGTCCDRVDLIVASRSLGHSIIGADICDHPRDRGPSDHCPIWVDIGRGAVVGDTQRPSDHP